MPTQTAVLARLPRLTLTACLGVSLAAGLAGCAGQSTPASQAADSQPAASMLEGQAVSGSFGRWGMTWTASNWKNGDPLFGCTFSPKNVTLGSGGDKAVYGWLNFSTCAEIKSNRWKSQGSSFGGDIFTPNIAGTTTTLFTYYNQNGLWNEIDAEFVPAKGKLHPALIYSGGGARYVYEGWRPASAGAWHSVHVQWQADQILWSLDGKLVFKMIKDSSLKLGATVVSTTGSSLRVPAAAWPTKSQQLIANVWRGSNTADSKGFLGTYSSGSGNAIWNNLY